MIHLMIFMEVNRLFSIKTARKNIFVAKPLKFSSSKFSTVEVFSTCGKSI